VKIALAQQDPTVGDLAGNLAKAVDATERARARGAELCVLSELLLTGYPPNDLLERESFLDGQRAALDELAARAALPCIVGFVDRAAPGKVGRRIYNAAAVIDGGRVTSVHHKSLLPTYDVFDEARYFQPANEVHLARVAGRALGITICEDAWNDPDFWPTRLYPDDPVERCVAGGAEILVNLSASPFSLDKRALRPRMLAAAARKHRRPLIYVNQVGGNDELVFDGHSMAFSPAGEVTASGLEFEEDLVLVDTEAASGIPSELHPALPSDEAAALHALCLGTRDYVRKCGFGKVVIGLSGGVDSALVAAIAAKALGRENVLGVSMPSRFSSAGSRSDATALAQNLGIELVTIPIEAPFSAYLDLLGGALANRPSGDGTMEENLQARVRGAVLMALSNRLGHMVLSTGNKSELAVGYCTLYGDMCGGLAVIGDVPKTLVYRLVNELNRDRELIPRSTIEKAPSAELRENQTDQDTLPPYDLLDRILEAHIEGGQDTNALVAAGFPLAIVRDVLHRVRVNEYKRRQAAPVLKLTSKAFGSGRRMPITNRYRP
jgi:NAD+ synthetase